MDIKLKIFNLVQDIMALFADKKYSDLMSLTQGIRLDENQIQESIEHYGRTILPLPIESLKYLNIIAVENSRPQEWSVIMPFWTREEGRSDLSLELTIVEDKEIGFKVELDDIHVL